MLTHPYSTKCLQHTKRFHQQRPRWCRKEFTEKPRLLRGNLKVVFKWMGSQQETCSCEALRWFSGTLSCYWSQSSAGCAIAHWHDASFENDIKVLEAVDLSNCLYCRLRQSLKQVGASLLKIAFWCKNRSTTHDCVTVVRLMSWASQQFRCFVQISHT